MTAAAMPDAVWIAVSAVGLLLLMLGYIALDIWRLTSRSVWLSIAIAGWAIGLAGFIGGIEMLP